jgi:4-hydroxybenzoate polyprenyltransferase
MSDPRSAGPPCPEPVGPKTAPGALRTARLLLTTMRPYQWTKNSLVFAGLLFADKMFHLPSVLLAAAGFVAFCAASSACYLLNDVLDAEADRAHPLKCRRPVASGELSAPLALVVAALLTAGAVGLSLALRPAFGIVVGGYLVLQIAYSTFLKHEVILDVLCISASFLLRAYGGCVVIDVSISHWLMICAGLLALFLALAKRRHELLQVDNAASHRRSLAEYSPQMLDQMIAVVTASTLVTYVLYTVWPQTVEKFGTDKLLLTVPFVLYGIFRYLYLVYSKEEGGCPSHHLLTDKPLLVDIVLYAAVAVWIIKGWKGR